jgi:hypothetical protein
MLLQNFALFIEEVLTLFNGNCGQMMAEDYSVLNFILILCKTRVVIF